MEQMHAHRIAFVEMPGVLRVGLLPDSKQQPQRPVEPGPQLNADEAMRRVEMARQAQAQRRLESRAERGARSTVRRTGGLHGAQGGSLDALADTLAKEAGASLAPSRRPPTTILHEEPEPDTGDDQTP
jgi:hypothetical protein